MQVGKIWDSIEWRGKTTEEKIEFLRLKFNDLIDKENGC